jgi:two-component system NtrC family sensor kinase
VVAVDASLAQSAVQLPWLAPTAPALAALAGGEPATHPAVANDPAAILLLLRHSNDLTAALTFAEARLRESPAGVLDRTDPVVSGIVRLSVRAATIANLLAERVDGIDVARARSVGLLAPLGWLAVAAIDPSAITAIGPDSANRQHPASIGRRLARRWKLPTWLSSVVGHLDLPLDVAPVATADAPTFALAQAAVAFASDLAGAPRLTVGTTIHDALRALGFDADTIEALDSDIGELLSEEIAIESAGGNPYAEPFLPDLLRISLTDHSRDDGAVVRSLEAEVDHLHRSLLEQHDGEESRLRARKLSALAEFAAGAGHEINNPLAVISGQAQYLLADESEPARQRSLQTIVQQAQRIHQILTDLMQFARPGRPQKRAADVRMLARAAATSLHEVAALRQVQIEVEEPDEACVAECDPRQLLTALSCLLRNAIEASLADGWARLRVEAASADRLRLVVEDSGPGPAPAQVEHLFDPFYSGRAAGRGRGLGLPTAWRLAREQGGDVTFEPVPQGPSRFVLTLPRIPAALLPQAAERLSA